MILYRLRCDLDVSALKLIFCQNKIAVLSYFSLSNGAIEGRYHIFFL